jgi:hypothetical protein
MSRYLSSAIGGRAVPGFIPGRPLDGPAASSGATVTPAVLVLTSSLPAVTAGARMQGKATASVTNKAAATGSVSSYALATAGVS